MNLIQINYLKSEAGYDNCFDLSFPLKEYIPSFFFEENEGGYAAELYFYIALFHKFGILDHDEKHIHTDIWSVRYNCSYNAIWFDMVFDEDYDFVTFAVNPKKIEHIPMIAEHIKHLVETEGRKLERTK